jgi:hypothetical protein
LVSEPDGRRDSRDRLVIGVEQPRSGRHPLATYIARHWLTICSPEGPREPGRFNADSLGDVREAQGLGEALVEEFARGTQPAWPVAVEPSATQTRHELEKPALDRERRDIIRMLDLGGHLRRDGYGIWIADEREPPRQ